MMGLGELLRKPGKLSAEEEAEFASELSAKVNEETGDIKLDTTDLDALGARIKQVRLAIKPLKAEEDRLRKLILAHPDAKTGYSNSSISIVSKDSLDLDDPALLYALHKAKVLGEAMNMSLSIPKVRKIAERVKAVDVVLKKSAGRQINTV